MRFVHSIWSKPANDGVYSNTLKYINPYLYGLSACYIKSIGHEIVLYADNAGEELLNHLPYDKIYNIEKELSNINTKFFAYTKFIAMQNEGNNSVHIDGDVIIKSKLVPQVIAQGNTITSFTEENKIFEATGNKLSLEYFGKIMPNEPVLLKHLNDSWYNTGLLRIKDRELFDDYIRTYFSYYDRLKDIILPTPEFNHILPDLVIEQQLLTDMARERGVKYTDINKIFNPKGNVVEGAFIIHYIGWSKYMFAHRIVKDFKNTFPKYYEEIGRAHV